MQYTKAFEAALDHAMLYEVGGHWRLTPEAERGLCATPAQKRATGYVNDPVDPGGETKFGIAKNANPEVNIKTLTWEQAKEIYYRKYWLPAACDRLPARLGVLHFDGAVNHGVKKATLFLQGAANVSQDGVIGPVTLFKISRLPEIPLCHSICDKREQFYRAIVANKPSQAKYLNGWLRRIREMREFTTNVSCPFV